MSRVGKYPVPLSQDVEAVLVGSELDLKGKLGRISLSIHPSVEIAISPQSISVRPNKSSPNPAMWGTMRALIRNMAQDVSKGFTKVLEINGVGYRASVEGRTLKLQLGFSHDIFYPIPEGISVSVEKNTSVSVSGIDRRQVGQMCAEIRAYRPPEPYKGKGIKYASEVVFRKEGKKK
jgi:large subunit ribosomal protein L6